ncbi:MAG: hypothetical protein M3081_03475 [Gemmatimonadota bacterium]|nr:hypothetical protein [Gemmatimonadota bacterium]
MKQELVWLSVIVLAVGCRPKNDAAADSVAARIASPDTMKRDATRRDTVLRDTTSRNTRSRAIARADTSTRHSPATAKPTVISDTTPKGSITQTDSGFTRIKLPDGRSFKVRNPKAEPSVPKDSFPKKP